jgi:hypothetical protein
MLQYLSYCHDLQRRLTLPSDAWQFQDLIDISYQVYSTPVFEQSMHDLLICQAHALLAVQNNTDLVLSQSILC